MGTGQGERSHHLAEAESQYWLEQPPDNQGSAIGRAFYFFSSMCVARDLIMACAPCARPASSHGSVTSIRTWSSATSTVPLACCLSAVTLKARRSPLHISSFT